MREICGIRERPSQMNILHILDHSIPLHSGYTFRTASILREQRALGWDTHHLTSPKQGRSQAPEEDSCQKKCQASRSR